MLADRDAHMGLRSAYPGETIMPRPALLFWPAIGACLRSRTMSSHTMLAAQTVDDCIIDQKWGSYTKEDHAIWGALFDRQLATLEGRVAEEYLAGLKALGIGAEGVPNFERMNAQLRKITGWEVV